MIELKGKYNKDCKIFIDDVETEALSTIMDILNQPVSENVPVRIMPDTHQGAGIVIGFCMPLTNIIKAEWVGVDIGCGMLSAKFTPANKVLNLEEIDLKIRKAIPMGFNIREDLSIKEFPFATAQINADTFIKKYNEKYNTNYIAPTYSEKWLSKKLKDIGMDEKTFFKSIGTLGGGNHFIELGISELSDYWLTIHTGSRNFGLKIANYWSNIAKANVIKPSKEYNNELDYITQFTEPKSDIPKKIKELKDKYSLGIEKEYLKDDDLIGYLFDMIFAQEYADLNRRTILNEIKKILNLRIFDDVVSCTHNYINFNDFIIRKGAISAYENDMVIIPWNMRDGLIIGKGKSNQDWLNSAPHGAGRLFSRSKAKELINIEDYKKTMTGIYSSSVDTSTIDESPFAYKDGKLIKELIEPTVDIIHTVKPILNIKDNTNSLSWKERKAKNKNP